MFCKNCGKELDGNAVACMGCGCNPHQGNKHCQNCGAPVEANQVVCVKCGASLASGQGPSSVPGVGQPKSRLVYILLAIFLGSLGIHNFYAGYTTIAVIQLIVSLAGGACTCGVSSGCVAIWAIVEAIIKDKDASGVPFEK